MVIVVIASLGNLAMRHACVRMEAMLSLSRVTGQMWWDGVNEFSPCDGLAVEVKGFPEGPSGLGRTQASKGPSGLRQGRAPALSLFLGNVASRMRSTQRISWWFDR